MKAIELFAGAGGLGLGVGRAGFEAVDIVEWDRWCCDTLRENRARGAEVIRHWPEPREGDVRKFSFSQFEGQVELVTGQKRESQSAGTSGIERLDRYFEDGRRQSHHP